MTKDELNTYKWLDAQEVRPRVPPRVRIDKRALRFERKIKQKILDNLDML